MKPMSRARSGRLVRQNQSDNCEDRLITHWNGNEGPCPYNGVRTSDLASGLQYPKSPTKRVNAVD